MLEKNNQVDLYFRDKTDDNSVYKVRISDDGEIQFKRLSTDGMTQDQIAYIDRLMSKLAKCLFPDNAE